MSTAIDIAGCLGGIGRDCLTADRPVTRGSGRAALVGGRRGLGAMRCHGSRGCGDEVGGVAAMQSDDMDPAAVQLLQLLADATRRRIFLVLMRGETCNCELVAELGLPHNLISHHLKRLRLAGLVQERRDRHADHWVHYVVNADALGAAVQALVMGLTPRPGDARQPCCERAPHGESCPTCASRPASPAPAGRRGARQRGSSTATSRSAR